MISSGISMIGSMTGGAGEWRLNSGTLKEIPRELSFSRV